MVHNGGCSGVHLKCPQSSCVSKAWSPRQQCHGVGGALGGEGILRGLTSSVDPSIDGPIAEWVVGSRWSL
jgi:hypothetical protein